MIHFLLLQKFSRVHKKVHSMHFHSSIEVVYIAGSNSDTLFAGCPWLSLVILGYPWLSLVILGYLLITLSGHDCKRSLQKMGKIIANAQTISNILELQITKDNKG